jgi:hypothetical protein
VTRIAAGLLSLLVILLGGCGSLPHPFSTHGPEALVDDRRVTSSVRLDPVREFPGLAEAVVEDLVRYDVLATTHDAGRRYVLVKGAIEKDPAVLVWRATTPDRRELGVLSQAIPPGADIPTLAQGAAPIIVQLLTASGVAPEDANRPKVALRPVRGPAGTDTRVLTQEMADALAAQGVAIGNDHALAIIDGEMRVLPGTGTQDVLQIDWTVRDPAGKSLGTVSQGNPVDRAQIEGQMASLAHEIAIAAAPGVVAVLRQKLPQALGGS